MKRRVPTPVLSALLFVVWLALNQSVSAGHLVLAVCFSIALPLLLSPFLTDPPRVRRPLTIARLVLRVLYDIASANIDVARIVLRSESRIRPAFVWVPLSLRDRHGLVALAGIVTLTPGTVSSEIDAGSGCLLVHVLDLRDEKALIAAIQQRYEAPLREIFE